MRANPKPDQLPFMLEAKGSVTTANAHGPKAPHFFKMKGRVVWILLQKGKAVVRKPLYIFRQRVVTFPKTLSCSMPHRSRQRP